MQTFACDAGQGVQNRWYDEVGTFVVVVVVVVVRAEGWGREGPGGGGGDD